MLCTCVFPDLSRGRGIISACVSDDSSILLLRPKERLVRVFSACCKAPPLLFGLRLRGRRVNLRVRTQASPASGEHEQNGGEGDKDVQALLVDLLRLETGKVRVNEFVEDRSKFLTEIAEQANEEFDRIAEEAKKTMDAAGSKVLEQIDAEASGFEEELAAARAEMEANEQDLDEFEKKVEKARSEGLFFKSLFAKPSKPWKAKSPEEQKEIKEKAQVATDALYQGTKKAAVSKFRRSIYGIMIILLALSILEAVSSGNVQWSKLIVYILLVVALVAQLTYETVFASDKKENKKK